MSTTTSPPASRRGLLRAGVATTVVAAAAWATTVLVEPEPAPDPVRLSFEAAGIDVGIEPLEPTEEDVAAQSLVPPLTTDVYWVSTLGTPGPDSDNTTYLVGHSWDDRDAPFNALSDASLVGEQIEVVSESATTTFTVDEVVTHDKDTLKDSDIWHVVPERLVLISCYTEDPEGKNVVVTASPAGPGRP